LRRLRYIAPVLCFICSGESVAASSIELATKAHKVAMAARDDCAGAWTQGGREDALEVINDKGVFLAATLNPISRKADEHLALLEEVTEALRECRSITFPQS
jgi:hypothetical protein